VTLEGIQELQIKVELVLHMCFNQHSHYNNDTHRFGLWQLQATW